MLGTSDTLRCPSDRLLLSMRNLVNLGNSTEEASQTAVACYQQAFYM